MMSSRSRWYFYNGAVPVPVTLPDGRVYVVVPGGYVQADDGAVRRYGAKFRPCARPADADKILRLLGLPVDAPPAAPASMGPMVALVDLGVAKAGVPAPEPTVQAVDPVPPATPPRTKQRGAAPAASAPTTVSAQE